MDEPHILLQTLWGAIQQHKTDMLTHFDAKMDPIQSSLSSIQNSLTTLGEQVNLLKQRVGANEDNVHDLAACVHTLEKDNLTDKVYDLENQSRRSTFRFAGIQESLEGNDIIGFMFWLMPLLLGQDNFPTPPITERAHRSLTA